MPPVSNDLGPPEQGAAGMLGTADHAVPASRRQREGAEMVQTKERRAGQAGRGAGERGGQSGGQNVVPLFQATGRGSGGESALPRVEVAGKPGLLPFQQIEALKKRGKVDAASELLGDQIQPASLDLRLGSRAYRIKASFLPGRQQSVAVALDRLKQHEFSLDSGAVLEQGCVYLVKLQERLNLPPSISA